MEEVNSSKDVINILFRFLKINFNNFGHSDWWITDYGKSWSPFVETCFMLEAMKYNNRYKIRSCSTHHNINRYIEDFFRSQFGEKYKLDEPNSKYPCRGFDISWIEQDNSIFLALEHSEDIPKDRDKEIDEDNNVNGITAINQLLGIRDEINKLKDFKSRFKVLISRPRRFSRFYENNQPTYSDSIEYFKDRIEADLRKNELYDDETWIIILIAPDSGSPRSSPNKIILNCYEWCNGTFKTIDETHEEFYIPIRNGSNDKCVINNI